MGMNPFEEIEQLQDVIQLMSSSGIIKKEIHTKLFGKNIPSRGYYIVIPENGSLYLHHDGKVKFGVDAEGDKPAFWNTEADAEEFFNQWRSGVLSTQALKG